MAALARLSREGVSHTTCFCVHLRQGLLHCPLLSRIWEAKSATTLDQKVGHTVDAGDVEVEVLEVVVVDIVVVDVVVITDVDDELVLGVLEDVGWMVEVVDVVEAAEVELVVLDDVARLEDDEVATLDVDEDMDVVLVDVSVAMVVDVVLVEDTGKDEGVELDAEHAETAGSEPE